jgi:hypothetical protein
LTQVSKAAIVEFFSTVRPSSTSLALVSASGQVLGFGTSLILSQIGFRRPSTEEIMSF